MNDKLQMTLQSKEDDFDNIESILETNAECKVYEPIKLAHN